uniref:Cohesin loading complex subunit SCC4 homolog n=2 Tax=Timema TaxID=61471 RepID=A0A7R9DK92_TIMCR|nr:unnamed protein product [Timema cristinae]
MLRVTTRGHAQLDAGLVIWTVHSKTDLEWGIHARNEGSDMFDIYCHAWNDKADRPKLIWLLSQMINAFDDVKFEAASVLAELYEQQSQSNLSKPILRKAIELSQHSVYWHCRLIFQLAQIHATERDYELASSLLGVGVDYAHISSAFYTRVLFLLSRCMVSLNTDIITITISLQLLAISQY